MCVRENLEGLDEEQLYLIAIALADAASRREAYGFHTDAKKMRITAEKVLAIKEARERAWMDKLLNRKEATA